MTFGSLFSGCGGFDVGFHAAGLECGWQCEIDPTARDVLARHWPEVERHNDVRDIGKQSLAPVDIIIGGFPCQDVSVAGNRAGLGGNRTGLWWNMLRIVHELRPRFVVWENVPGLLSSDSGRDFARVVFSLGERGYFGTWRVLDARHFGVPQRRRRVFGVFARGRAGAFRCAEILALREGVPGHLAAGGEAGKDVAGTLGGGPGNRGWAPDTDRMTFVAGTLGANHGNIKAEHAGAGQLVPYVPDVAQPIRSNIHNNSDPGMEATMHVAPTGAVRRLTPRECERLMGWPDDWTRWRADGREIADGPRYRMCGNGVVGTVSEWIARRIMDAR